MAQATPRRGRPKGTGIDDSAPLERLADMLSAHPDLKPTTAIRRMGFTDPSAIRRLRDKYKAFCETLPATSSAANPPHSQELKPALARRQSGLKDDLGTSCSQQ